MSRPGFPQRFRRLAFGLSLLALLSALWAPAAVLAQDLRQGLMGLCSGGLPSSQDGHAGAEDHGHCDLCGLPVLAMPPVLGSRLLPAQPIHAGARPDFIPAPRLSERPAIRAPPALI